MPAMHARSRSNNACIDCKKNVNKHASTDPDHLHKALDIQAYRHINKHIDIKKSATKSISCIQHKIKIHKTQTGAYRCIPRVYMKYLSIDESFGY